MGTIQKNSLSYLILLTLEKSLDGYMAFEDFAYHPMWDRNIKKSEFSQALKRLREKGYIKEDKTDVNKIIFKLIDLGRDALGLEIEEEWDGKWRIVIFDIPEEKRIIRNLLRRRLKGWGFRRWQQSVWITKRNVTQKLRLLITDLQIENWIAVIESEEVLIGNKLLDGRTI